MVTASGANIKRRTCGIQPFSQFVKVENEFEHYLKLGERIC
jgi:hypothetical protein